MAWWYGRAITLRLLENGPLETGKHSSLEGVEGENGWRLREVENVIWRTSLLVFKYYSTNTACPAHLKQRRRKFTRGEAVGLEKYEKIGKFEFFLSFYFLILKWKIYCKNCVVCFNIIWKKEGGKGGHLRGDREKRRRDKRAWVTCREGRKKERGERREEALCTDTLLLPTHMKRRRSTTLFLLSLSLYILHVYGAGQSRPKVYFSDT